MILKKYKNNLLAIIQESGLEPNLFIAKDEVIDKIEYFIISTVILQLLLLGVKPHEEASFNNFMYQPFPIS